MPSERLQVILQLIAGQYKSEARQAAAATGQIGRSAKGAGTATSVMGRTMDKVAGGGLVGLAAGGYAAKKAFDVTIGAFASFDDKMTESLAIMGDVSDEMRQEMSDAAREVAKETTFSAEQAAESYFFLASAGLDAEQSIAAMPQVAKFAQAGMFDMALATDLATDAQSSLGLTVDDSAQNLENLTRVTDVFVKANALANTSVQQISEAFTTKAGAALRSLNKDVEEGAAVLAAFADQGVKGAEAGTQFSIVLRDLQTKALQNEEAFAAAGVAVFDAAGNMRNLADIIGDIESALAGMSDAEKKSTLLGLGFSDKSVAALTTLLGTSDAIREYEAALRDAGGTTEEVADKQLQSASKQWELFLSALQDVGLELGENVLPALSETVPALQDMAEALGMIAEIVPIGEFFDSPIPDDIDERAGDAVKELGFFEKILYRVGRTAAIVSPEARVMAQNIEKATDAFNKSRTGAENHNEALRIATSGYGMFIDNVGSADDAMLNMARRGGAAADAIEDVGDESATATPSLQDYAAAVRDVRSALLELANPAFAAVEAVKRRAEAEQEYRDLLDDPAATEKELADSALNLAEARLEADAALSAFGAGNKEGAIRAIADALETSYQNAEDLLEAWGILDAQGDIVLGIDISMDPADRALLNSARNSGSTSTQRGYGGGRAGGGPMDPGRLYRVGEGNRPELYMVPGDGGRMFSNMDSQRLITALSSIGHGGGDLTINLHGSGVSQSDIGLLASQVGIQRRVESSRR